MGGVLVFRHVPHENRGFIAPALERRSVTYRCVDFYAAPDARIDVMDAAALI